MAGPQGIQGARGIQGSQGFEGISGPQGLVGPQGYQGANGLQGFIGAIGLQGLNGSQGLYGPEGFQGLIGSTGLQGAIGAQSFLAGNIGIQGAQGAQGYSGKADVYYAENNAVNTFTGNSNAYFALDGPSLTINLTKTSAIVLVFMNVYSSNFTNGYCYMSVALSGKNTVAESNSNSAKYTGFGYAEGARSVCGAHVFTGLNIGNSTTFSAKYKGSNNQSWSVSNRRIVVIPF